MKKILFLLLVNTVISVTTAQVNIEKYNNLINKIGSSGSISFYLSAKTGNTDIQQFGIDGRFNYTAKTFYTFLVGQGEYGWKNKEEFSNNALLHLRYIHNTGDVFNPEVFYQINYNKKRKLLFRSLFGGGVRIILSKNSETSFIYGTSYMYEYEDLDLDNSAKHPTVTNHHRWNNYLSYSNSISKNARLSIVVYAQPRFDDFGDIRILSENHLGVELLKTLSLSVNFSLRYDSKPPDGIKDLDTSTKVGLSVKL
jgi:putative salt-induced outer membrane protein YdiY